MRSIFGKMDMLFWNFMEQWIFFLYEVKCKILDSKTKASQNKSKLFLFWILFLVHHKDLHHPNRSYYVVKLSEVKLLPCDTSNYCPKNLVLFKLLKVLYSNMQLETSEIVVCFGNIILLSVLFSVFFFLCDYLSKPEVNMVKYQILIAGAFVVGTFPCNPFLPDVLF